MSIMDYFRSAPAAQQAPAQAPATPQGQVTTQPAGQVTPAPETTPAQATNPLDEFKTLWDAPKEGETPPASNFDPSKMFQIDPAKIQQAVSQMDFTQAVTPDLLQQIAAGGEAAMTAFTKAMNSVAQTSFTQSMIGASKLVETAMVKANESLDMRMKEGIRQQQISSSLRDANPALSHPAAQPIVAALEAQFTQKYPTATPAEVTKMAQDYLTKFATAANPSASTQQQQQQSQNAGMDWDKWLTS